MLKNPGNFEHCYFNLDADWHRLARIASYGKRGILEVGLRQAQTGQSGNRRRPEDRAMARQDAAFD